MGSQMLKRLRLTIFHYQVIISPLSSPGRPYEWWHFELCKGDWFVSLKLCMSLERVNILTYYIQLTGVFGPPPRKTTIREPRGWQWFRQRNGKAHQHVENRYSSFIVSTSRLFRSNLWHLLGECNGREPFLVSALLFMNTPDWKIYT